MPFISSPVAYPPSSSPPAPTESRKRPSTGKFPVPVKKRLLGRTLLGEIENEALFKLSEPTGVIKEVSMQDGQPPTGPFVDEEMTETEVAPDWDSGDASQVSERKLLPYMPHSVSDRAEGLQGSAACAGFGRTTSGKRYILSRRNVAVPVSYERLIAQRSTTAPERAQKSYYGIDIHTLINEAEKGDLSIHTKPESIAPSKECPPPLQGCLKSRKRSGMMWTEKYRARKYTDLVGDERTHRNVLRWLKGWDPIVFPGAAKPKANNRYQESPETEERAHRKILLLTGPPGLGKTTLAHVCAKQAGYEVVEINASDERSREVVRGRIRDCVGTENVRGVKVTDGAGTVRKPGCPVCVVVDEVDGVVGGSGGAGEGGFMKALIDLILLDQRNASSGGSGTGSRKREKGDRFRLLRPMILICNDVYHPSLKPLRSSNLAEIVHIRKPPLDKVVGRLKTVLEKEGIDCDGDGVRRLCEATWGISSRKECRTTANNGEGDIRGVLVVAEGAAAKLRGLNAGERPRLTRQWVEKHMISDLSSGGSGVRGLGGGGTREVAERVFLEGAGFPRSTTTSTVERSSTSPTSVSDLARGHAINLLRNVIDTTGEPDRILTDVFTAYPSHPFQDDTFLSKPNAAYDWLHFHDTLSSRVHTSQEWELNPYLSTSILGFHHLFASSTKRSWSQNANDSKPWGSNETEDEPLPFTGPRADFSAYEAAKQNHATLQALQSSLSIPLMRLFRSPEDIATDLLPQLIRMLTPDVKPVIIGGSGHDRSTASVRRESEREMVRRAVEAMAAVGVSFERSRVEDARGGYGGFVYRMEPPLDTLASYETASKSPSSALPTRYAIRQVLDQEHHKFILRRAADARQTRFRNGGQEGQDGELSSNAAARPWSGKAATSAADASAKPKGKAAGVRRDFFGRVIPQAENAQGAGAPKLHEGKSTVKIWVSYHEGFSNAVRKPITLAELMRGL